MTIPQAFELALRHHQEGRLAPAEALYRQILAAQPKHADALHLLGLIAHQAGRHALAVDLIRQAIALDPNNPAAHCNLGEACRALGRLDEAIANYRRALELTPDYPEAHNNLGAALAGECRLDEAIAAYRRALQLKPGFPEASNNLGEALRKQGRFDESIAACHQALRLKSDFPEAQNNLGAALAAQGQLDAAIAAYRRAIALNPGYADAHNNLAIALKDHGALAEAIIEFRNALALNPEGSAIHSNLIYTLLFQPGVPSAVIAEEWKCWNRKISEPLRQFILPHANDRDPERRLRVGYVSPDFRDHVIGRNLLPLLRCHDRSRYDIVCYSGCIRPDKLTDEFRQQAQQWRNTAGVGDAALAEMIRQDGVDILVDLTQHMAGNRLAMFARQPAPVQVSFAGYPEGAGLETIGYRISDPHLEGPSATDDPRNSSGNEQVCLIDSFWCYDPCGVDVEVNEPPATASGIVTFGCLNNFCKINEPLLKLWARALLAVSDSRLILLSRPGSHRQRTIETLTREGVAAPRVEFVDACPRREYLELYHRLDIALDTFPYNGHTTSLDALWMGVPVVTLAGATPVSRAGLSQLTNLGLPELVAHTESDYVAIAEGLARDLPRLAQLRSTLRDRMKDSVLMDAPRFARQVEQAYQNMWHDWLREQSATSGKP
jgi:predicted O-linked N-acetylglucosamine transferase (SPINDLY family)